MHTLGLLCLSGDFARDVRDDMQTYFKMAINVLQTLAPYSRTSLSSPLVSLLLTLAHMSLESFKARFQPLLSPSRRSPCGDSIIHLL
jgi:hypothetical protein